MRKLIIGAVTATAIAGGSIGVAAFNPLGPGLPLSAAEPPGEAGKDRPARHGPGVVEESLQELVAAGTITQAQADAIRERVKAKAQEHKGGGRGKGHGPKPGHGPMFGRHVFETAARAIGIDPQALKDEHKSGKSIAEVATAHGVDPQKVIDAVVSEAGAGIDQAVAEGKLPADRAAKAKERLSERVTKLVNRHPDDEVGKPQR